MEQLAALLQLIAKLLGKLIRQSFGHENSPIYAINGSLTLTAPENKLIYCIKPLGADITIASATDEWGKDIPALTNVPIKQGDEYKRLFKTVVFSAISSGQCVTGYIQNVEKI